MISALVIGLFFPVPVLVVMSAALTRWDAERQFSRIRRLRLANLITEERNRRLAGCGVRRRKRKPQAEDQLCFRFDPTLNPKDADEME